VEQATGDSELLEGIRRDEPGAFDRFVDRFGDRIYGFSVRMCGQREDARDVLQDTLLKAYTALKDLRHPEALRSWVFRVAANACLMKRRRGKFESERELSLDELMPGGDGGAGAGAAGGRRSIEIPDVAALPDESLERSELAELVQKAVEQVPAHYRIVLVLRDMEGLSTHEASEALGIPETAVKMRLHRARLMVRKELEAALAGGAAPSRHAAGKGPTIRGDA
jgi:RNA polymerase sigma-70 factor (ECF subfamily)